MLIEVKIISIQIMKFRRKGRHFTPPNKVFDIFLNYKFL